MTNENQKPTEGPTRDGGSRGTCCSGAGKWMWLVLAVAIGAVFFAKSPCPCRPPKGSTPAATPISPANTTEPEAHGQGKLLPRLVDLGATKCIPCKMMAPILEDLKKTYAGKLDVVFIDVWQKPEAGKTYGIRVIPTQIFISPDGKELFRHEGFFSKEDILEKWKEFGFDLLQPE